VDNHAKHLRSKSTNMSDIKPTTNTELQDRLYGEHYPDSFLDMPKSVCTTRYGRLDNNDRYMRQEHQQSDQSSFTSKPIESRLEHICPNNPILTCNCTDPKYCAELGSDPDRQYRDPENRDGFSDNLDYTGIPIPKGKGAISGWPCVVVGAVCETWTTASECVSRGEHSAGHTEQHTDAGFNNDGPSAATKL
jgi:hypothetical protein